MLNIILSVITSVIVVIFAIPTIRTVAKATGLYDQPDKRKLHKNSIPRLGGLAIFAGFSISVHLWGIFNESTNFQYLDAALLILFFSGLKDDVIKLPPLKKLIGQILATLIIVWGSDLRLKSFYGIFGIYEIPLAVSLILTVFSIVVIINAFNLIDGIDGLAGGIGIITAASFGTWFYLVDLIDWAVMAFALCGGLLGFLFFNFSSSKIFMGDAGSLTIGFLIAVFAVQFIDYNASNPDAMYHVRSAPAAAIATLIIPLFDTLRVFILRLIKRKSPFEADNNHIHHAMLKLGLNHVTVSTILYSINLIFVVIAFLLKDIKTLDLLLIVVSLAFILSQIPTFLYNHRMAERNLRAKRIYGGKHTFTSDPDSENYTPLKKVP